MNPRFTKVIPLGRHFWKINTFFFKIVFIGMGLYICHWTLNIRFHIVFRLPLDKKNPFIEWLNWIELNSRNFITRRPNIRYHYGNFRGFFPVDILFDPTKGNNSIYTLQNMDWSIWGLKRDTKFNTEIFRI